MKRAGIVVTVVFALIALIVGFVGGTAAFYTLQPSASSNHTVIRFVVNQGDTANSIGDRLQQDGLIRNALLFRLLARYRKLDTSIEQGVYNLSPDMTMDQIIRKLQSGIPDLIKAGPPDSLRVTQYPQYFTALKNFDATAFLQTAKTGIEPDGTKLWQKYWYVEQPQPHVAYALEGYLYPAIYFFDANANTQTVIETMLNQLGAEFCPGDTTPYQYVMDQTQCKAHAVNVNGQNIFTAMEKAYFTTDDRLAIYRTLTIAGLTTREILNYSDAKGVAGVYHNRFLEYRSLQATGTALSDTGGFMGSDPSAEYARDTDHPPTNGKWWADLGDYGKNVDPQNPYNTEAGAQPPHPGLPPGPIAAALNTVIYAAAAPVSYPTFPYFYFVSDKCGKIYYAKSNADFEANVKPKMNTGSC